MSAKRGRMLLGTSGFSYQHWRGDFYAGVPAARWLESYAERFCSVEINLSFYRLPAEKTLRQWRERTPDDFEFVIKGSRTITHYRRLDHADDAVASLFHASSLLGEKLSCFLWQLPPRSAPDLAVVDRFCSRLDELADEAGLAHDVRHAFEFRDRRWFSPDVLAILRRHGHGLVIADPAPEGQSRDLTSDFAYLRFHHGPRSSGAYQEEELDRYAESTALWLDKGVDVYAYFNNDPGGWAPRNAATFRDAVARRIPAPA